MSSWTTTPDWLSQELADRQEKIAVLVADLPDPDGWRPYADAEELGRLEEALRVDGAPCDVLRALDACEALLRTALARHLLADYQPPTAKGWLKRLTRQVLPELAAAMGVRTP
jgi:hypothetical protein